ncbi:hypothetical protein PGTUg99_015902 [Puccinia graminis f. sp. tritici]|uniref:Uncharacterized protein n=1 Tax=Puccinia graminis f. sp. tritici TaxID=56615 RepID=A0A5B0RMC1_PUCGR|nr:hypothetical protein PGTUg99_015902 [Puccinia graminis f. sp. tritici]
MPLTCFTRIHQNRIDQVVEGGGRNFCWSLSRSPGYRHTGLNPPEGFPFDSEACIRTAQ